MNFEDETIWIIGASSGIGKELSIKLASHGAKLILSARRESELKKLQKELGPEHKIYPLDVSDKKQVKEVCAKIAKLKNGVDRVLFMPALYKPDSIANMDLEFMSKAVDVNIKGAMYITHAILPIFEKQKSGQIALCGSVAGYTGLPNGQPYSATKAAIINFAESLHAEAPDYINIKLISPGFVQTPMTAKNDFDMPMIITPQKAASYI
ncbi:SDR family NAD(P)-dependent oxidoreductase, partial [Rickettsiales bacterium]|nr:SDR family NAD(P)-dependent oxidoreductase [Rickettsiales bacterium]